MPDVVVEVAFGSGYATPDVDRTWTDVSDYVELDESIGIQFGRQDERSIADANTLDLTLDNSDGRFTALRPSSPYYPDVRLGTPIRVLATPVGGTESVRFVGYVEQWPVSWDGTDEHATAEIQAVSRMTRLGYDTALRSVIEETFLVDSPVAYYTLGEPQGATSAADTSGNAHPPLTQFGTGDAVTFGTAVGPGTDDLTAAVLSGEGRGLQVADLSDLSGASGFSVSFFVLKDSGLFQFLATDSVGATVRVDLSSAGQIAVYGPGSPMPFISGVGSVNDGLTHHIAVTWGASEVVAYIDGAEVGSDATAWPDLTGRVRLSVTQSTLTETATLAHLAVYASEVSAGAVADQAAAGSTGFAGESAADRLARYASWAGIPAAEVSSTAATTVVHVDPTGSTAIDAMRLVETAEGGILFDDRDGTLTLLPRSHRYAPTGITLDMAAQRVGGDFNPVYDRTGVLNDATVSNVGGTVVARVVDHDSSDYLGPVATSLETISDDDGEPYRRASWEVHPNAEPKYRTPSLTVDLLTFDAAPSQDDILAASIGTLATVTNQPDQAATTTGLYFIEGCTETIGPESYSLTFNVSPGEPYTNLVIFDDADQGFDSGAVFAY